MTALIERAVEVLRRRRTGPWSVGSGCLVGGRLALTAAHNVLTDGSVDDVISVRRADRFELTAEVLAADPAQDLAVLRVADHPSLTDMPAVRYARIDRRRTALVECWAMGYPGWNEHPQSGTDGPLRDSSQINGVIPPGSHLRRGLLEFRTQSTPEGTPGRNGSQWRGMSGAVVFSDDSQLGEMAVGVISEHHLPEGASTLTVVPLTGLIELGRGTPWWWDLQADNWVALPRIPAGALPRTTRHMNLGRARTNFTDRERAIVKATGLLVDQLDDSAPVVVLHGMAGVGKTELATQIAHRLAPTFWHARIRIDLGGEGFEVSTEAAMIELLQAFGQSGDSLPADARARRQHLQDHLRAGPSLLVLDNVADAARVVPLLPAAPGSAAILTSRSALPSVQGADRVEVEPLPDTEALRLFERIVGAERVARERDAADTIVTLLGGLPLAICITGGNLIAPSQRRRPLSEHAGLLADERRRISRLEGQLDGEDAGVRSSFEISYRALREDTRRLFRYLGLLAGADFVPGLAARCAGIGEEEAGRLLGELADRQLVEVDGPDGERYRLHDLLRLYAREHAERTEPEAEWDEAFRRSLDWYATRLETWMSRPGAHENLPAEAIDWFTAEHLNVQANIRRAYESHEWELLLRLVAPLYGLLFYRSQWEEMEAVKAMAVEAARTRHDESAELGSLIHLAEARRILGRREETTGLYERALEIARTRGDEGKQGWILTHFGDLQCDLERPGDALRRYAEARAIYRQRGDKGAEIWLSAHMADAYRQLDRPQDAARVLTDALEESRRRGDPAEIVWCQWHLALAYDQMGRYAEAEETLAPATEFHRHRGDQAGLATMLTIHGDIHLHAGRPALARETYGEALELVRSLDIPRRVAELEAALERASG
ncbi:tetratricopeptide repeat protein [Streptomyces olivochromogenes]|uniref:tetratricopeptide repeat protein n=1 Tax=Streptomyces olivochromogenes TaxID=1963 RepID=UPI001F3F71AA|nr:tetratricopeptide repeat protein [Streptomyces olivochromogenes]MCF3135066.1 tetratricopeptide repeat protein [Streptomyces olivochromogenes]